MVKILNLKFNCLEETVKMLWFKNLVINYHLLTGKKNQSIDHDWCFELILIDFRAKGLLEEERKELLDKLEELGIMSTNYWFTFFLHFFKIRSFFVAKSVFLSMDTTTVPMRFTGILTKKKRLRKVLMQGKLIEVVYTLRTYWNQFSLDGICK